MRRTTPALASRINACFPSAKPSYPALRAIITTKVKPVTNPTPWNTFGIIDAYRRNKPAGRKSPNFTSF